MSPPRKKATPGGVAGKAKAPATKGRRESWALNVSPRPTEENVDDRLVQLDEAARAGDVLAGLRAVRIAVEFDRPLPRWTGSWLHSGLGLYLPGRRPTLDDALGLSKSGRADPRRALRDTHALLGALGRMFGLHLMGATIDQAALLVSRLSPEFARETLRDRYARGGYGKEALALRRQYPSPAPLVEAALSEYPDNPIEVREAKRAILKMSAKLHS